MNSKQKGSKFERKVSRMIREALGLCEEEVYRTPMSGAHFALGRGVDIQIVGDRAIRRFPYAVECKHVRTWSPEVMLRGKIRAQEASWLEQVLRASAECGLKPMLVTSGNGTGVWASTQTPDQIAEGLLPRGYFSHAGATWVMVPLEKLLELFKGG